MLEKSNSASRDRTGPIFVVGCPRSGTTWLYHLLVSSRVFANYRAETHFFDLFLPRYGSPRSHANRRRLADAWISSPYHLRTGLEDSALRRDLLARGTSPGAFLSTIMEATAAARGADRWADSTPAHALHIEKIAHEIPDARFVHVVRDGRDVALSLAPRGWIRPLPWDRGDELTVAGWRWQYIVERAQAATRRVGERVMEVRYEALVEDTAGTVARIGEHVGAPLDMDRILAAPIGSVADPNTSFREKDASPIGRWRTGCTADEIARLEAAIGSTLARLGYETSMPPARAPISLRVRGSVFRAVTEAKERMKRAWPLSRYLVDPMSAAPPTDPPDRPARRPPSRA